MSMASGTGLLTVESMRAGYGDAVVLDDISFEVPEHGSLAVLGRNGVGKSTLLLSIMGCTIISRGRVTWRGKDITRMQAHRRARAGLGWVAQEREIFPSLTVEENLTVASQPGRWDLAAVYELFPRLAERRTNMGNQLSGGEQQMLAVARTLMINPALLLLDEPLEGLAPIIVDELLGALRRVLRNEGMSAIIVEQKAHKVLGFTDRAIILDRGHIVFAGDSTSLAEDRQTLEAHLGVTQKTSNLRPAPPHGQP
jgi:branched-chain amino acid transport system ATP-binding protein